jgi:hypothetical protein
MPETSQICTARAGGRQVDKHSCRCIVEKIGMSRFVLIISNPSVRSNVHDLTSPSSNTYRRLRRAGVFSAPVPGPLRRRRWLALHDRRHAAVKHKQGKKKVATRILSPFFRHRFQRMADVPTIDVPTINDLEMGHRGHRIGTGSCRNHGTLLALSALVIKSPECHRWSSI